MFHQSSLANFNETDPRMDFLEKKVTEHFPVLSISFNQITTNLEKEYHKSLTELRRTTLLVIEWKNIRHVNKLGIIYRKTFKLSLGLFGPKLLIVISFPESDLDIKTNLEYLWTYSTDVTFLKINQYPQVMLKILQNGHPTLNQLNPFNDNYTIQEISAKTQWFPNKLHDLKGFKLNFTYDVDSEGIGYDVDTMKLAEISYGMNFKFDIFMFRSKNFDNISFRNIINKAEMSLNKYLACYLHNLDYGSNFLRILNLADIKAMIPRTVRLKKILVVSDECSIVMIAIIRLAAFLLKFKNSSWETFEISQIIMGMSFVDGLKNFVERIILGSLLFVCIVYSGYIYSVILGLNLETESEISSPEEYRF